MFLGTAAGIDWLQERFQGDSSCRGALLTTRLATPQKKKCVQVQSPGSNLPPAAQRVDQYALDDSASRRHKVTENLVFVHGLNFYAMPVQQDKVVENKCQTSSLGWSFVCSRQSCFTASPRHRCQTKQKVPNARQTQNAWNERERDASKANKFPKPVETDRINEIIKGQKKSERTKKKGKYGGQCFFQGLWVGCVHAKPVSSTFVSDAPPPTCEFFFPFNSEKCRLKKRWKQRLEESRIYIVQGRLLRTLPLV